MTDPHAAKDLLSLTARIVSAHVGKNQMPVGDLPKVIDDVYRSLSGLGAPQPESAKRPDPAVPIKRSVMPDYVVCLEDGRKLKMLKRHLKSVYGLSPDQYRARWGLTRDYPMVAPNYARQRSRLAKEIGLGTVKRRVRA